VENDHGIDRARIIAADLAHLHYVLMRADEFYRYYREAIMNLECNRGKTKPKEWIPLSNQ
jgi:hypothetical protein